MAIVQTGLTLDEFLRLPEQKPALEFLDGQVSQKAEPKAVHSALQVAIAGWLDERSGRGKTARVFIELHAHWPNHASLCPDVSVYLIERVPTTPDGDIADDFWLPPDIAVEIASPGQSVNDQTDRANLLLQHGVRVVVLVEPRQRRVRVARPGQMVVAYQGDDMVTLEDVLPGFSFGVRELFSTLKVRRP